MCCKILLCLCLKKKIIITVPLILPIPQLKKKMHSLLFCSNNLAERIVHLIWASLLLLEDLMNLRMIRRCIYYTFVKFLSICSFGCMCHVYSEHKNSWTFRSVNWLEYALQPQNQSYICFRNAWDMKNLYFILKKNQSNALQGRWQTKESHRHKYT